MLPVKLWNTGKEKNGALKCLGFVTEVKIIFETNHTKIFLEYFTLLDFVLIFYVNIMHSLRLNSAEEEKNS